MQVRDVMTPSVATVAPAQTIGHAKAVLDDWSTDLAVVTSDEIVLGTITRAEIDELDDDDAMIGDVMLDAFEIHPDRDVGEARASMDENEVDHLVVVDAGMVVGVVTKDDLTSTPGAETQDVRQMIIGDRESRPPRT